MIEIINYEDRKFEKECAGCNSILIYKSEDIHMNIYPSFKEITEIGGSTARYLHFNTVPSVATETYITCPKCGNKITLTYKNKEKINEI